MTAQQMQRLVENVQRDGQLTSLPLVRLCDDGILDILSGHHRVQVAVTAGFDAIDVLVILTPIDEQRATAIQLSHNAITGQDDRSLLAEMYDDLDLDERKYSGLSDELLGGFGSLNLSALSIGTVTYQELRIDFLPEDAEQFGECLSRIKAAGEKQDLLVARYADFTRFFDTLIAVKGHTNVHNAGIALALMAELACERLQQLEMADGQGQVGEADEGCGTDTSAPQVEGS